MALPHLSLGLLIALVAFVSLGEPPFASARTAMIPEILGEGDLFAASSTLGNTTNQFAVVAGFALGGGLVATIGAHTTLLVDVLTFVASGVVTVRYVNHRPAADETPGAMMADLAAGAHVVFANPKLRWIVVVTWLILGAVVSTETAAVPYAIDHGDGSLAAGLLIASLPLGIVVGGLLLGRAVSLNAAERLMLPLALATPALLALTAFNPAPIGAGLLWFVTGVASAMTVTANRVFVVSVPREIRGRAFGIAVTGIAASQGIFSFLTGLIARYVGPAHAIADLALPTFALVVAFSVASVSYSPLANRPITEESPAEDGDPPMSAASPTRPALRVWALTALLAGLTLVTVPLLDSKAYIDVNLTPWWLLLLFVIGFAYPLTFEIRHQTYEVLLETVPFVLGLIFLSPLQLVATRALAIAITHGLMRRQRLMRWVFNLASTGTSAVAAIAVFRWIAPSPHSLHPATWPAVFAAVATSDVVAGLSVMVVVSLSVGAWRMRQSVQPVLFGVMVSTVMTFLALCTAASLNFDVSTAWAISVFVVLAATGLQTYHRLAERAAALDRLHVVARELGPIAADPSDLAPALFQLREIVRARRLELVVSNAVDRAFETVVTVLDPSQQGQSLTVDERPSTESNGPAVDSSMQDGRWSWLLRPMQGSRTSGGAISARVHTGGRALGILTAIDRSEGTTAFERGDIRLLEAAADQLAAALEKGRLVESLRRAATLDTLTGLANLDSLRSFLDTTLEGAAGGVLVLLNLDRFHEVNDMLGHDAGDAVLAEVARRLESAPSQGALVARVGGDQFAIAIPGAAGSEVAKLAAMAVKSRVDGSLRLAEVSADVRVTVGIARAPDHGSDGATLLRRAEMAMAAAKGSTSGIGEWEPAFERDGSRRLQLLTGLRAALSDGTLRVEYQPKFHLGSGEVAGFEALVRWSHPDLGPVSPAEFVPLAEATGLVSALTSTVLRQALTACRSWHDAGSPTGVAVNVSARSLDDNVLVGQVAAMLTASGLEPRWLTLEITESSVMEDHARSLDVLRELRMLGVRLSIDDFGTGYSSLHQLRGLPVHEVKIDKTFIDTVDSDEADRAVVRAVVELCDSLGLVTVAEGVEKAAQAYALDALGVSQVQGYFHGMPMPDADALEWLASRRVVSYARLVAE
jgi:diguanylate cyclase (GGDEF)-like protein